MTALLSYENAPKLGVPLPFFVASAAWGAVAGVFLALHPDASTASRLAPVCLVLTHLLTLGVLANAMLGALFQLLPVVAGQGVPGGAWGARMTFLGLNSGTILLTVGLWSFVPAWLQGGAALLGVTLTGAATLVAVAAWRSPAKDPTTRALRLAGPHLTVVVTLGVLMVLCLTVGLPLPLMDLMQLHAVWGVVGWVLLLILGVGTTVVPMFQVTPAYPTWFLRTFLLAHAAALVVFTISVFLFPGMHPWGLAPVVAWVLCACGTTLWVQHHSKRPQDVTRRFWQLAHLCFILAACFGFAGALWPLGFLDWPLHWTVTVLALLGGALGAVNGMLLKIVPFLVWLHMKNRVPRRTVIPTMQQVVTERQQHAQGILHGLTVLLFLAAPWSMALTRLAGLSLALQAVTLMALLVRAWRLQPPPTATSPNNQN